MASNYISPAILLTAMLAGAHAYISINWTAVERVEDIDFRIPDQTHGLLSVYALPVGQGDCTIIQCPNGNIAVIDCGSSGGNRLRPEQIKNFLGDHINNVVALVITHPDTESYSYLNRIQWYKDSINQVIIGGNLEDYIDDNIHSFLEEFHKKGKLYTVNDGKECIGACEVYKKATCTNPIVCDGTMDFCKSENIVFDILAANIEGSSFNEKSIVMKFTVGQWSMLLPGDMEGKAARDIAKEVGPQLKSVVYKMAEHGASGQANQPFWLKQIQPKKAFASSSYNSQFYHSRCETIGHLKKFIGKTAPPHLFYCGQLEDKWQDCCFEYNIYETSPTQNVICSLMYNSNGHQSSDCYQVKQTDTYEIPDPEERLQKEHNDKNERHNGEQWSLGWLQEWFQEWLPEDDKQQSRKDISDNEYPKKEQHHDTNEMPADVEQQRKQ